jgi:glycerol kinase
MQVVEVLEAMNADVPSVDKHQSIGIMRVDGGACASDLLMQMQADLLGIHVERPAILESTVLGAAYFAGLATGVWTSVKEIESLRRVDRVFAPMMSPSIRVEMRERWRKAIEKSRGWEEQS